MLAVGAGFRIRGRWVRSAPRDRQTDLVNANITIFRWKDQQLAIHELIQPYITPFLAHGEARITAAHSLGYSF